jgi:hypothetical protein
LHSICTDGYREAPTKARHNVAILRLRVKKYCPAAVGKKQGQILPLQNSSR